MKDFIWYPGVGRWVLEIRIKIPQDSPLVPTETAWHVNVEPHYPFGDINVFPAKVGGLRETFPHQSLNIVTRADVPWRLGDLCLQSPFLRPFGKLASRAEPRNADRRMFWHVARAIDWLAAAAAGELLRRGDPYELPAWPNAPVGARTVVFDEGVDTFSRWSGTVPRCGRATLIEFSPHYVAVLRWSDFSRNVVAETRWGAAISDAPILVPAVWLLLASAPTLQPWRAPLTWKELRAAAWAQGTDLDVLLQGVARSIRGVSCRILLVGFPIPAKMLGSLAEVHWQPLAIPKVVNPGSMKGARWLKGRRDPRNFSRGFRNNALGRWMKEREKLFADDQKIVWYQSQNWHSDRIGARGRLMARVRLSRIAIVGVGALGSLVAELLVRQGAVDLLLIDADKLKVGNLVRHRLKMESLEEKKAEALAEDLNLASPHANVRALSENLPWGLAEAHDLLEDRELVIDCTGDDAPLMALAQNTWDSPKFFASVSVGREARRLYFFTARGTSFPFSVYEELVEPWLSEEHQREVAGDDSTWEGAGCWHPLFPARFDDLMLMAATATKLLEAGVVKPRASPSLQVFQRREDSTGLFQGLERVERTNQGQSRE